MTNFAVSGMNLVTLYFIAAAQVRIVMTMARVVDDNYLGRLATTMLAG